MTILKKRLTEMVLNMNMLSLKYFAKKIFCKKFIILYIFIPFFVYSIASTLSKYVKVKQEHKPFYDFGDSCDLISPYFIPVHITLAYVLSVICMAVISKIYNNTKPDYNRRVMLLNIFCVLYIIIKLISLNYFRIQALF